MAKKSPAKRTTIEAILDVMRTAPTKTHRVADLIAATKRPRPTLYSVIYSEAKKEHPRVAQTGRGVFELTAAGRKEAKAS